MTARKPEHSPDRQRYNALTRESDRLHHLSCRIADEHTDYESFKQTVEESVRLANEAYAIMLTLPVAEQEELQALAWKAMAEGFVRGLLCRST